MAQINRATTKVPQTNHIRERVVDEVLVFVLESKWQDTKIVRVTENNSTWHMVKIIFWRYVWQFVPFFVVYNNIYAYVHFSC
jgi:hypothetical protein